MNYHQTLNYLYNTLPMYQRVGKVAFKKDLTNTLALSKSVGNPHQKFKSVHIAGTNGKGSSAHQIAAILQSSGYKTGLYTSPHLKSFTERIRINGKEIDENAVVEFVASHQEIIKKINPSFFEITVVMAFDFFAKEQVDIAVVEVGLGGRLDSTNVITPVVSLITNIGWDHQDMLGKTLPEIAVEKAGIIKKGVPVIIGQRQAEVADVFIQKAKEKEAPLLFANERLKNKKYKLQLKGNYQKNNLPGVLATIEELRNQGYEISDDNVKEGLEHTIDLTGIKGRWQLLGRNPTIVCDTAHNKDGIQAIVKEIHNTEYKNLHIVWGMVKDKDTKSLLTLLPKKASYYYCEAKVPRAKNAVELQLEAKQLGQEGIVISDVNQALAMAKVNANEDDMIFVGGSTFVVGEIEF